MIKAVEVLGWGSGRMLPQSFATYLADRWAGDVPSLWTALAALVYQDGDQHDGQQA